MDHEQKEMEAEREAAIASAIASYKQREERREKKAYASIRMGHAFSRLAYHVASQALIFGIAYHFLVQREEFPFDMPGAILYAIIALFYFVAYVCKRKIDTSLEAKLVYERNTDPWILDKVYRLFYTGPHNSLKYMVMGEWLLLAVASLIYNAIQPSFALSINLSWFVGVGVLVGIGGYVSKDRFFTKVFKHLLKSGMLVPMVAGLSSPKEMWRGMVEGMGKDLYEKGVDEGPLFVLKDPSHRPIVEAMYRQYLSMQVDPDPDKGDMPD